MKPFSIIFGLKSIARRKQKNFFGILAIALGVSLITGITITDQSLSVGFGIFFTESLGEVDGSVTYKNGFMNQSIANAIGSELVTFNNITAYATELSLPVTTSTLSGQINTQSLLKGISAHDDSNTFGKLVNSTGNELNVSDLAPNEVFIGQRLANDLGIKIGQVVTYSLSLGSNTIEETLVVKDIVKDTQRGSMGYNSVVYMSLTSLQTKIGPSIYSLGFPANLPVTVIYLKFDSSIKTVNDGKTLVTNMKDDLTKNLPVLTALGGVDAFSFSTDRISIKDYGKSLADSLGTLLTIFGSILIIAGLILIVNIQLMAVENKEKQIGIQRAVGTKIHQIIISNLIEFVIAGLVGGLIGIFGGAIFGWILILSFGYAFDFDGSLIPLSIPSSLVITAFLIGFLISILAGLYPAIKASRINVMEVLRGVENREFKVKQGTGIWGFSFGLLLTVLGLLFIMNLSKSPFDYPNAYRDLSNAEGIYIATTFLMVGVLVLLSYFLSRNTILTITSLALLFYPILQIFVIFDQIKEGSGGEAYILLMIISLIGGSILLISINLDKIASFSELIFSPFFSAVSLISFKQMSSQKTRSTLTFAIFAFILTLNIFLASWSYSVRYGSENQIALMAGGSDILIIGNQALPTPVATQYISALQSQNSHIDFMSKFPSAPYTDVYLHNNGTILPGDEINTIKLNLFSINNNTLIQNGDVKFNFLLDPNKLNTTSFSFPANYITGLETDSKTSSVDSYKGSNIDENKLSWKFLSSGLTVTNKTSGKILPVIITSPLVSINLATQSFEYLKDVGDSVWLPLTNGTFQEFVIMAISPDNPLFDSVILGQVTGTPSIANGAFIQEKWTQQLAAFNPGSNYSLVDQANYFLLSTTDTINSGANKDLSKYIEDWSNGLDPNSFRSTENKLYGLSSTTVYSLYETAFDGQFRLLQFMQYFTTLGFLFGVVSLLVVSVRSVQERKREIGMMRSIGIKKREVIVSLILELSVMGTIGLLIGLIIGNIMAYGLVRINSGGLATFIIPWVTILIYVVLTLGSAFIASIIPGRVASQIPPSDALRYTG